MNNSELPKEERPARGVNWDRIIGYKSGTTRIILLSLVFSWLGLLGGLHWSLDLTSHFRWQYLIASLVAVLWTAWARHWKSLAFAILTFLLNAALIGRLAWHPEVSRATLDPNFKLTVLSMNVLTSNANKQQVLDHVLASNADVVFLMEVNREWAQALQPLKAKYPHHIHAPREDNFGLSLHSRIPWTKGGLLALGMAEVPSVEIEITHQGRDLTLIGTHPLPPIGGGYAAWRDQQLAQLSDRVAWSNKPVLVVGDLNATPWSAGLRLATASGKLGFRSLSPAWTPTWRVRSIFAIPIDHALCTAPLVISDRSVGSDVGSDHRPLQVTVGWEK
jgi:endonuclease/exonuclease/phosphatase (EEP) superfamily protein YafD